MKALFLTLGILVATVTQAHNGPAVPEPMELSELLTAFGMGLDDAEIVVEKVTDDLFVLFGAGGNIAVSIGEDGVLIVDDQFPELIPRIEAEINQLGGKQIDFAINTHWHFDHAEGNLALGPGGTWLVSQANSRRMMREDHIINLVGVAYEQKAYPAEALPVITYDETMQFHFNGQQVELMHFGPAHTTGDTAIIFRGNNAVHLGDVFNNAGYPFIDAGNGGSLEGVINFCQSTLAEIDEETVVIPGHGPITNYQALVDYTAMLTTVRDKMLALIMQGATLEEVAAAKITAEFDEKLGDSSQFINRAYMSMTHNFVDR